MFSETTLEAWTPSPDSESVGAEETDTTTLPRLPSILVEKTLRTITEADGVDPTYSDAGDAATFDIHITNTGNTRLNEVVLTDDMFGDGIACDHDFSGAASGFLPSSHADGHPVVCEGVMRLTSVDVDAGFISGAAEASGLTTETLTCRYSRPA